MRISDWSSDVCSSDLAAVLVLQVVGVLPHVQAQDRGVARADALHERAVLVGAALDRELAGLVHAQPRPAAAEAGQRGLGEGLLELRSEEHTSELQSLLRTSYAVFCLNKKTVIRAYRGH